MFLVSDEAFALLVLYNKHHVWKENIKQGEQSIDSEENSTDQRKQKKEKILWSNEWKKTRLGFEGMATIQYTM